MNVRRFCLALIFIGVLFRFYRIDDVWKQNDHYNFGGVHTTMYAECLKSTPLSVSKGVPHGQCWTDHPIYYRNHPPTILFAMWAWTSVFGSAEWAYRSFILFFSLLNIGLIFLIGRQARGRDFPYLAAACQACFLGNMYFGTHPDFIGEFTVTFVLLGAWLALRGRMTGACMVGLLAGISAWPGYIFFAPLAVYAFLIRRGLFRVIAFGVLGALIAVATMMWLQQTGDVIGFLMFKIFTPHYLKADSKGWAEPLFFIKNFVVSQSRLLSPVLAGISIFELFVFVAPGFFKRPQMFQLSKFQYAVLLSGGTGVAYALLSHEYFMVHVFLYLLFTPALALCAARFVERLLENEFVTSSKGLRAGVCFSVLICAAIYPFGIFQSSAILDASAGALLVISSLILIYYLARGRPTAAIVKVILALAVLGNVVKLIDYRREPDRDHSFCVKARQEYDQTHQPIHTTEPRSEAKTLMYCKDLPIIYDDGQPQ